jgi:hypothetical protein
MENSKNTKDIISKIDFDEVSKIFFKKLEIEHQFNIDFLNSKKYKHIHKEVIKELEKNKIIQDDVYVTKYLFSDVTNDDFINYFNATIHNYNLESKDDVMFYTENININGLIYEVVIGQGSIIRVYKEGEK